MGDAIDVRDLSFRYRTSSAWALRGVSLRVSPGEFVLVTGPTGSGKSTLLRAINGLVPDFYEGEVQGTVQVLGRDVLALRPNQVATFVGTVFQSPEDQIIASKVGRDVAFGLENLGLGRQEIAARTEESLLAVGLRHLRDREASGLSGGQLQRLALASIVAMRPRLLLLDEPASEIDPRGRREILGAMERLARTTSHTVVIADHRLADLVPMVDRLVVLHEGQVAIEGTPREVMVHAELEEWGVEVPRTIQVWRHLASFGFDAPCPLTPEELAEGLTRHGRALSDALESAA